MSEAPKFFPRVESRIVTRDTAKLLIAATSAQSLGRGAEFTIEANESAQVLHVGLSVPVSSENVTVEITARSLTSSVSLEIRRLRGIVYAVEQVDKQDSTARIGRPR